MIQKDKLVQAKEKSIELDSMDGTDAKLATTGPVQTENKNLEKTQKEIEMENQLERQSLLENFEPSNCSSNQKSSVRGGLSIVYAPTGKRISLSQKILTHLPSDVDSIQIGYSDRCLLIGTYLDDSYTSYKLKKLGSSNAIYNTALVQEITERYNLDFLNRSSLSFPIEKVEVVEGFKFIFINMAQ